jgi:hypothetical protein
LDIDTIDEDKIKEQLNEFICEFFDEENGDFFKIRKQVVKEMSVES